MISISASVMAYSLKVFFDELEISRDDAAILASGCSEAGLNEVIDLALIEPAMVPMILGPATDPLGPTLLEAAAWAEKVAEGWARGERNMIGGEAAGRGRVPLDVNVEGNAAATRTPGWDPPAPEVTAAPAWACPEEARGEGPSVARSARLLVAFTARTLKKGAKNRKTPGPANPWRSWSP